MVWTREEGEGPPPGGPFSNVGPPLITTEQGVELSLWYGPCPHGPATWVLVTRYSDGRERWASFHRPRSVEVEGVAAWLCELVSEDHARALAEDFAARSPELLPQRYE